MRRIVFAHCFLLAIIASAQTDILYQVSTLDALVGGVYEGKTTLGSLKTHGDFGIGTFNAVDGEMMLIDGLFYRVDGTGKVSLAPETERTPFAAVTFFEPDITLRSDSPVSMDSLYRFIDGRLPSENLFYAVRIIGSFGAVRTRSVPRQTKPYVKLTEVVKTQPVFSFSDVKGMMVGFRCPSYAKTVNYAGFHMHFLAQEGEGGGHVLGFSADKVRIEIDVTDGFHLALPDDPEFYRVDLSGDEEAVKRVEK
ncbi:MAG: acetolactate decarboxylase [bacterium]|nr:acetolactate decarboxylase [bacterium]